jgi:lactate dehydrogenase-like 2-hydroxyacid dehydrogenase
MKIVFLDAKTLGKDISLDKFNDLGEATIYETTKPTQTLTRVKDADVVITNKVVINKDIIENSNLKLICVSATGTNNIDLEYAKQKGIPVKNVSGYSTNSVAQLTITLALDLIQKIDYYKKYVSNKQWCKSDIFTHIDKPFYELEGKTWGIIGLGNIGMKVANIAKSFGCNVYYYSTSGKNSNSQYEQKSLEELLEISDVISIHCPLTNTTKNLINKSNLKTMKEDVVLINVARGGIINEEDLCEALDSNKSLYCGLDVVEEEPIREDNPLLKVQNKQRIIITPHVAWASIESRNKLIDSVYNNVKEYML